MWCWMPLRFSPCFATSRVGKGCVMSLPISAMTTVNLAEVVGHFVRNGAFEPDIRMVLDPLPVELIPFDDEMTYTTGLLLSATRRAGLSLGDRACLALAGRLGVPALTADP